MENAEKSEETAFAPAARAGGEMVAWLSNAFLSDPTAVALLEAMPGPAMVLNRQRQIVAANSQLQVMFAPDDCAALIGLRPGEVLGCVRAHERPAGCGTTPACAQCGAVQAILESLETRGRSERECRVRTSFHASSGAFNFRVCATWANIGGEEMVVFALVDIQGEKNRQFLERTLFTELPQICHDIAVPAGRPVPAAVDEVKLRREFGDLSSRVLARIEEHRQLLAAESGELEVVVDDFDARVLLQELVAACRQSDIGHGREIVLDAEGAESLCGDRVQLGRVVDGLLQNALEATPVGGRVDITAVREEDTLTIQVGNAGVIPDEVQQLIFQRSFSTKEGQGRGIGTYRAKLLVERYLSGSVEFVSNEAHGTVFTVAVPDRARAQRAA